MYIECELKIEHRYLNVPVRTGEPRRLIHLIVGGQVVRAFEVELAPDDPDFWGFLDVEAWHGQTATIRLHTEGYLGTPESHEVSRARPTQPQDLQVLRLADEIADAALLYREPQRPQFHFSTRRGWLNDPNGLLYYQGEYHLFYQYQPFSMASFSDKYWGHAVSRDLVRWEELPVAIYPDANGAAWSGSTLIDDRNVAGLQSGADPALLLFYTSTGRSAMNPKPAAPGDFEQRLAFSNDRGRSWTMFAGNPVLRNITPYNRDPLVFWHEPSKHWVMVLYVGYPVSSPGNHYTAQIFNSENLKDWTYQSRIEGFFDCPILFELPLDGNAAKPRWIIHCADMKYKVGQFDGKKFTPETELIDSHKARIGESAYAPQMFRNMPGARHVQMAWLYDERPGEIQIMAFPTELSLVTTPDGPRLCWQPVAEIRNLYDAKQSWRSLPLVVDESPVVLAHGRHLEIQACIEPGDAAEVELSARGIPIVLHARAKELRVRGYALPLVMKDNRLQLRILLDETSLEIFADDGLVYLPLRIPAHELDDAVALGARGGAARAVFFEITAIKSIWSARAPSGKEQPITQNANK